MLKACDLSELHGLVKGAAEAFLSLLSSKKGFKATAAAAGATLFACKLLLRRWQLRRTPPGSMGLPLFGESLQYLTDPAGFVKARKDRYGPVFKTNLLFAPTVHLSGEYAKLIIKQSCVGWPRHWLQILGRTSMTAINGTRHKFQRQISVAAFTDKALASYLPVLQKITLEHLKAWVAKSQHGAFNPHEEIKEYTFDVAERILLGCSTREKKGEMLECFRQWVMGLQAWVPFNLPFTTLSKAMKARAKLISAYQQIIDEKRAVGDFGQHDMLSLVMNEGKRGDPMTDEELCDFCLLVQFAGHDTTLASLQSIIHYLKTEPGIWTELESEVTQVWDGITPLTWEQAQACQNGKCGRFITEVLRVATPVKNLYRELQEEITVKDYRIPKGWKITASIQDLHDDLGAPKFDMSMNHGELRQLDNCPFGVGSRMCIGYKFAKLELLVLLMCLLRHHVVHLEASQLVIFPFTHWDIQASFGSKSSAAVGGA